MKWICWMSIVAGSSFNLALAAGELAREPAEASVAAKSDGAPQAPTPADQLHALLAEYETAYQAMLKATNDGDLLKTPPDQYKEAREKQLRQVEKCASGCVELAGKFPQDPAALDALFWVVSHTNVVRSPENVRLAQDHVRALKLLQRDHLLSDKLGPFCRWLANWQNEEGQNLAEEIQAKSPHRAVQAEALLKLADSKLAYSRVVADSRKEPGRLERHEKALERLYGEKIAQALQKADLDLVRKEAEQMYERLVKDYADVPDPATGTMGKRATLKLNALRAPMATGQQAPEIEGQDIDGKKFKLSDFRGKVVLLAFTGDWCEACTALYAQQRSLVKNFAGKPFALVDVNGDEILERRKKINAKENVTWPSFQERISDGPTAARWGIGPWPTLFLIDDKGVIRQKYVGSPGEDTLRTELEKLIEESLHPKANRESNHDWTNSPYRMDFVRGAGAGGGVACARGDGVFDAECRRSASVGQARHHGLARSQGESLVVRRLQGGGQADRVGGAALAQGCGFQFKADSGRPVP
jgi:peroxiredoxin